MSVGAAQAELARCRRLAATNPAEHEPDLGLALYALCMELHQSDSPVTDSYLDLLQEGIDLHRRLLGRDPKSVPQLGFLLCYSGFAKFRLGWDAEAKDLLEEGLGLIRSTANTWAEVFEYQLAAALGLAAHATSATGDHDAAVSMAREALGLMRQLVEEEPGEHDAHLVAALHTLCHVLSAAGRDEEALAPAEESVRLARELGGSGDGGARSLAHGLDYLAMALSNSGRPEEALPVAEEAVRRNEHAARNGDRAIGLDYARALINLSKVLMLLGNTSAARRHAELAWMECLRRARDTTTAAAELSATASDIARVMTELGQRRWAKVLVKLVNRRLAGRPGVLGGLIGRLRRR